MLVLLVDWVLAIVLQGIVHPAEVPFIVEAKSAVFDGGGDLGEIGGVFRNHHDAWMGIMDFAIEAADEFGGPGVLAFGFVAIPEDDVADRVDADAIEMEIGEEIVHRGHQEASDRIFA